MYCYQNISTDAVSDVNGLIPNTMLRLIPSKAV